MLFQKLGNLIQHPNRFGNRTQLPGRPRDRHITCHIVAGFFEALYPEEIVASYIKITQLATYQ
ncbi:MAG: hypothetical protein B6245_09790 [Desulfobacteraceae bacterium 4572_88]|nr:MAG: hypothetical protein B6245_09790 [Desulfobacteraceae bacterium 4572_88]